MKPEIQEQHLKSIYGGQPSGFPCIAEWTENATPQFIPHYRFMENKRKTKN